MKEGWHVFETPRLIGELYGWGGEPHPLPPWHRVGTELLVEERGEEFRVLLGDIGFSNTTSDEGCGCCSHGREWRVVAWRFAYLPL